MRTTIVIDDEIYEKYKPLVNKRKLSRLINQLLKERLEEAKGRLAAKEMREGYLATRRERKALNEDWDEILAEGWE